MPLEASDPKSGQPPVVRSLALPPLDPSVRHGTGGRKRHRDRGPWQLVPVPGGIFIEEIVVPQVQEASLKVERLPLGS